LGNSSGGGMPGIRRASALVEFRRGFGAAGEEIPALLAAAC
jgi:hypothetical protein